MYTYFLSLKNNLIFFFFHKSTQLSFQDEKNQVLVTNVWLDQVLLAVCIISEIEFHINWKIILLIKDDIRIYMQCHFGKDVWGFYFRNGTTNFWSGIPCSFLISLKLEFRATRYGFLILCYTTSKLPVDVWLHCHKTNFDFNLAIYWECNTESKSELVLVLWSLAPVLIEP